MDEAAKAIRGVVLVDGNGDLHEDTTIVWTGQRITWIGSESAADLRGAVALEPAAGTFIMAGLIDAHVHLVFDGSVEGVDALAGEPMTQIVLRAAQNASRFVSAGITTVRDLGSRDGVAVDLAGAELSDLMRGPRIVAAGRAITPTGGHGWMVAHQADGVDAVRRAVRVEIARGAEVIKLFLTGGVMSSANAVLRPIMTVEEAQAATQEAHARNVKVAAHVHGPEGVDIALQADVDTIEHGSGLQEKQAEKMRHAGVTLVPTLMANELIAANADQFPRHLLLRSQAAREMLQTGTRIAIEAGVTVLAGSDAGMPFDPPGLLANEIHELSKLGLGAKKALQAATSTSATALGLRDAGELTPGTCADLIVLDGDPLEDLTTLQRPLFCVRKGRLYRGNGHKVGSGMGAAEDILSSDRHDGPGEMRAIRTQESPIVRSGLDDEKRITEVGPSS